MAGYKPKYSTSVTGRHNLFRRICSYFSRFHTTKRYRKQARPQAAVMVQQRKRQIGKLSRTATAVLLLSAVIGVGGLFSYRMLASSDIFRVAMIDVEGNKITEKGKIMKLGGIEQGTSLLGFDCALAEDGIRSHPWIDRVEISRSLPSTLKIRVYEHRPLAMINIKSETGWNLFYIDHGGRVIAPVDNIRSLDFPVITGIESAGGVKGTDIAIGGLEEKALRFLRLAAKGNPIVPLQSISEVHINASKGLVVYLVDTPFPIYMGYDDITNRYYQLVKLLERLYRKNKMDTIKEIRMDYDKNRILVAKVES